jgi:hypothetical protein
MKNYKKWKLHKETAGLFDERVMSMHKIAMTLRFYCYAS